MQYLLSGIFAVLAILFWRCVWSAVRSGMVQKPRGNQWWREERYYRREVEPVRYWLSLAAHAVMAILATAATVAVWYKRISP